MGAAQKHREKLIETAIGLMQRQGYAGTGLSDILAASGAPRGSLYHYFPDGKEALAAEALRAAGRRVVSWLEHLAAGSADAPALIRAYGKAAAASLAASGFAAGCPIATVALETAPGSAALCAAAADGFAGWAGVLAAMLRADGVPEHRAAELGDFAIACFEGALLLARVRTDTAPILTAAEELAALFIREPRSASC